MNGMNAACSEEFEMPETTENKLHGPLLSHRLRLTSSVNTVKITLLVV